MAGELVTGPGLIQWGTLLLGRSRAGGVATTPYRWGTITGWEETPALDSGTVARAQDIGAWPGRFLSQVRTITVPDLTIRTAPGALGTAVRTLELSTGPGPNTEQPLVVQLDERGPLLVWARLTRRALPVTPTWQVGWTAGGALQWECSDPRRYVVAEQSAVTGLPAPESGLSWGAPSETGLSWGSPTETGLAWGTPGSTGDVAVTNSGTAHANPIIEFRGPVTTPSITLLSTGQVLEYGITLALGDVLTVDTWAGTVLLGGQSRIATATLRSSPEGSFVLPAGTSTLSFRAAPGSTDPAASATVRYRSAYW
ncbi:phage distal tail protein [Kitasatospora viridis]|uniref:Tail protein n=1 Tax=Kitasatospora viridis TaxID=281105 RepID=A0A561UKM0_9ACTN|nr:phage tail domain-containing protein [Kitasatospora viridis]TWF99907.1 tail protein [Kitasatospora viridis]